MGVLLASENWLNHWDGRSADCWRTEFETSLVRNEVQLRLKKLAQHSSTGGYVIRGASGTGKRELVRAAFQGPATKSEPTWVSGSYYGSAKPYGAIQFLLTGLDNDRIDSPLAVFGFLKQHFASFTERAVIILEHVALIDPLTTAVLCQLVSNKVIKMIVIDDLTDALSGDLASLVRNGVMEVFHVNEQTLAEARAQISMMLDLNVSYLTAITLWEYTAGSSEALRAVVLDCQDAGMFVVKGDAVALRNELIPVGVHMQQHVARRLERLNMERRSLLEQIALDGPLRPVLADGVRDTDIDFLFARGLLQHAEGSWTIANPAILRTLCVMQGDLDGWDEYADNEWGAAPRTVRDVAQSDLQMHWAEICSEARFSAAQGRTTQALSLIEPFLAEDQQASNTTVSTTGVTVRGEALLLKLELSLAASHLSEAHEVLKELEPAEPTGGWFQLGLCQQHRALAFLAEYHSRCNQGAQAEVLLEALLEPLEADSVDCNLSECMVSSLRSLINTTISLGKWEQNRKLIQLVLAGTLSDLSLVAYAETVHAIMLGFAGNFLQAQKIIAPLQLQLQQTGTNIQRTFVDSVDLYVAERSGQSPLGGNIQLPSRLQDTLSTLGLECLWQTLCFVTTHHEITSQRPATNVEALALWAEQRGEDLIASHLWASIIRSGGFHAAPNLRELQKGQEHQLAAAFRMLSDGAENRDAQLLATAVGALAALGFVSYATDDGSAIFQLMNNGQRRQAARKANTFMTSLQPVLVHPEVYANLGQMTVLTEREKFVASAAASGLSNLEIAEQASVSVRTVEGHLYQVYSKLGIRRRGELTALTGSNSAVDAAR